MRTGSKAIKAIRVHDNLIENAKGRSAEPEQEDERRASCRTKRVGLRRAPARSLADKSPEMGGPITRVAAKIDVGFGNALFIRGQGAGLSWERGMPLECVEGATWIWSTQNSAEPVIFKLLINDQLWCQGENLRATPGTESEVLPAF